MHVLLIEDDTLLGDGVQAGLQAHGFSVAWVTRAADADAGLDSTAFDLVVLDLGLPDQDGLSLLARWRRLGRDEPVLVLTALARVRLVSGMTSLLCESSAGP